jgi:hypothetical protein
MYNRCIFRHKCAAPLCWELLCSFPRLKNDWNAWFILFVSLCVFPCVCVCVCVSTCDGVYSWRCVCILYLDKCFLWNASKDRFLFWHVFEAPLKPHNGSIVCDSQGWAILQSYQTITSLSIRAVSCI